MCVCVYVWVQPFQPASILLLASLCLNFFIFFNFVIFISHIITITQSLFLSLRNTLPLSVLLRLPSSTPPPSVYFSFSHALQCEVFYFFSLLQRSIPQSKETVIERVIENVREKERERSTVYVSLLTQQH